MNNIKIFSILFLLFFSVLFRGQDKEIYVFQYKNPESTVNVFMDYFIVIEKNIGQYTGYFYANSDQFNESREGYCPAYFVKKMDNLIFDFPNKKISFDIELSSDDFLYGKYYNPISLTIRTTQQALEQGYTKWKSFIGKKIKQHYYGFLEDQLFKKQSSMFIYKEGSEEKMIFTHKIVPENQIKTVTNQSFLQVKSE